MEDQNSPMRRDKGIATIVTRRTFLRRAMAGVASMMIGTQFSGCLGSESRQAGETPATPTQPSATPVRTPSGTGATAEPSPSQPSATSTTGNRVLLVSFSRAGENYYYGGRTQLEVGNTDVLAGMISQQIECDVYRIEPVDPYSDDYDDTVARNVREQEADARPAIANPLASIEDYDIVLLGSPIWNVRPPMIMRTFAESFDFTGKTIFPFTTHAMSGLGTAERDYAASCPGATIGEGLAVRGEEVQAAGEEVDAWLRGIGLLRVE